MQFLINVYLQIEVVKYCYNSWFKAFCAVKCILISSDHRLARNKLSGLNCNSGYVGLQNKDTDKTFGNFQASIAPFVPLVGSCFHFQQSLIHLDSRPKYIVISKLSFTSMFAL